MPLLGLYRDFITPLSQLEETWCWLWLVFQLKKTESFPLNQAHAHILRCFPKHRCKDFIFLEWPNVVYFYSHCHKFLISIQTWFSMWLLDIAILRNSLIGSRRFYVKSLGFFWRQPEPRQRGLVFLLSPLGMPFAPCAHSGGWEREGLMIKLTLSGRNAAAESRFVWNRRHWVRMFSQMATALLQYILCPLLLAFGLLTRGYWLPFIAHLEKVMLDHSPQFINILMDMIWEYFIRVFRANLESVFLISPWVLSMVWTRAS